MCVCVCVHAQSLQSCLTPCEAVDCSPPGSMGFSRQEYWSEFPCPSPGDLPDLGIEPTSLTSPALADRFFTTSAAWEALNYHIHHLNKIYHIILIDTEKSFCLNPISIYD